jgi:IS30 family transposase
MDTIVGRLGGAVLVTMVERLSRFCLVMWAPNKTAEAVEGAIVKALHPLADRVHTLTYDNGKEFAYHAKISKALQAEGFFAHPYHSWERGLNENTNGLIRQYLPKRSSFDSLAEENIVTIKNRLNNRPRKCLGFKTPNQVFFGINPPVGLAS